MERLIHHRTPPVLVDVLAPAFRPALASHDDTVVTVVRTSQSDRYAVVLVTVDAPALTEQDAFGLAWDVHDDIDAAAARWREWTPDDTFDTTTPAKVRARAYTFVVAVSGTIAAAEVPA